MFKISPTQSSHLSRSTSDDFLERVSQRVRSDFDAEFGAAPEDAPMRAIEAQVGLDDLVRTYRRLGDGAFLSMEKFNGAPAFALNGSNQKLIEDLGADLAQRIGAQPIA